jgi:hypothetical protein
MTADDRVAALLRQLENVPARHHRLYKAEKCEAARDAAHDPGFKRLWAAKAKILREEAE